MEKLVDSDSNLEKEANPELMRYINGQLAKINGEINVMDAKKLKSKLVKYSMSTDCNIDSQRKLLKKLYRRVKLANIDSYIHEELLPYYVVIDFEATCEEGNPPNFRHEIIEFPAVLLNTNTLQIEDTFRRVCKPSLNPTISKFCTELTGITQEEIDSAEEFPFALSAFEKWLKDHRLGYSKRFAIVTDGPWDFCRFLYSQCIISNVTYPPWARKWVNIRKVFTRFYHCGKASLASMLADLGMSFDGRKHCGLDDAKNITRILTRLICDGANIQVNETISLGSFKIVASSLNDSSCDDLEERLKDLNLEGERLPIQGRSKIGTFENVKKERYKREVKLAMSLKDSDPVDGEVEDLNISISPSPARKFNSKKVHKKKKKKGKLCH